MAKKPMASQTVILVRNEAGARAAEHGVGAAGAERGAHVRALALLQKHEDAERNGVGHQQDQQDGFDCAHLRFLNFAPAQR